MSDEERAPNPGAGRPSPWRRRLLIALLTVLLLPVVGHYVLVAATAMEAPPIETPSAPVLLAADDPTRRDLGRSYARKRGAIYEVRLVGGPEALGWANITLLRDDQLAIEREMREQFAHFVPLAPARTLLVDLARLRFSHLDELLSPAYKRELAAQAAALAPDPLSDLMPTYQRFVFLHSLYDIMLSFERSPLIGCSSLVLEEDARGHTLVGRNFDFEGPQILDDRKAVFLVFEDGKVPYASVSWPGFIGTASGMNAHGVSLVIHGARAGETDPRGEPVAQTFRDVLGRASSTEEALALIGERRPIVPHMFLVADATGDAAVAERVPHEPVHVRRGDGNVLPLSNHLEGPHAADPKNQQVRERTSTLPRRARLDALAENVPDTADVSWMVSVLRDKRAPDGSELPLGDRSAIDALIATHSVVLDATGRSLWVSEGPYATGRFVRFDLEELLDPDFQPRGPAVVESLPQDDIRDDGRYNAWQAAGRPHSGAE